MCDGEILLHSLLWALDERSELQHVGDESPFCPVTNQGYQEWHNHLKNTFCLQLWGEKKHVRHLQYFTLPPQLGLPGLKTPERTYVSSRWKQIATESNSAFFQMFMQKTHAAESSTLLTLVFTWQTLATHLYARDLCMQRLKEERRMVEGFRRSFFAGESYFA